ncbi:hypothetical protein C8F04DRAFT_1192133 [Mycena alexandri]|uniref:Uncharacterized protein n=1 Tax=Mycena alexandri TaxID=1745969 RepID=A0AAD6WTU6_9AGAR|nr:hypothetical protein C8F04DRAFT_1192133 [Mycena alexandri]
MPDPKLMGPIGGKEPGKFIWSREDLKPRLRETDLDSKKENENETDWLEKIEVGKGELNRIDVDCEEIKESWQFERGAGIHPWCQQVVHIQVMNLSATAVSAYWWTQPVESKIESSYRGLTTTTKMTPVCVGKSRVEGTKIDGGGDCKRYCGYLNPSSVGCNSNLPWIDRLDS